ncbi:diaminopimelate decarboxylase [Saprospiraceae bacterium]|nr:diaminopimelate decarboxylase [Bacteroidota bacterium]MDB4727599.1 diaminopimelate decarboxylase [Saprospiraceae bacterium]
MELQNGRFMLTGGVDPLQLVEEFDSPIYVYDTAIIKRQFKRMKSAFGVKQFKINYACKALTNINILKLLRELGSGIDCVSIQEVQLAIHAGFKPHDIMFTPNGVSLEEIELALGYGVRINIDNISILEQMGHAHPNVPVGIRINPHVFAGGNAKISVGHIDSKFGISIHQMPHVLKVIEATGQTIDGIHMHTGSDILDSDVFLYAAEILLNVARDFKDLTYVDFGSGFKVPYKQNDISTDVEDFGEKITARFNEFCEKYGRDLTLIFEPGKYLVSESGYFLVKVNVVKSTPASLFAGIDSGMNHLIRPMFYDSYHRIENISQPNGRPRIYTVVGYICETDTFGVNRKISEIREGDILCFHNAGAYCFSMASNYNSRFRPAEVMVHEGEAYLIRKRETMDDLMRNQVEVKILEKATI